MFQMPALLFIQRKKRFATSVLRYAANATSAENLLSTRQSKNIHSTRTKAAAAAIAADSLKEENNCMITTDLEFLHSMSEPVGSIQEEEETISRLEMELDISGKSGMKGIGLAAPQAGMLKRAAIVRIDDKNQINLVNARIIDASDNIFVQERCLSVPGKTVKVLRKRNILLENNQFSGQKRVAAYGISAVCIQHELDHLDGVLMTDREVKEAAGHNLPCPCGSGKKYKQCCK